ncbi:hypothetical protein RHSIM_Rhsim05G0144800 [Rhododendron simsii]|uniref:Uncharacterized protein n=1 Tax=Rhododendron simsii TaxID=118357 RepID=A0A834GZS9_RHOSS|nr:hypothetical protein RHSIM_Rhsim05G0144800 [Rhododendron simsii]
MDRREKTQLHSPGICNRLLNSFRKRFAETSLKVAIFGCLLSRGLALCCGLFDSIVQHLASQAVKPVILGPPAQDRRPSQGHQACVESEQASTVLGVSTSPPILSSNCSDFMKDGKELQPIQDKGSIEVVTPESATQARGPPEKMVSINDRAEENPWEKPTTSSYILSFFNSQLCL